MVARADIGADKMESRNCNTGKSEKKSSHISKLGVGTWYCLAKVLLQPSLSHLKLVLCFLARCRRRAVRANMTGMLHMWQGYLGGSRFSFFSGLLDF